MVRHRKGCVGRVTTRGSGLDGPAGEYGSRARPNFPQSGGTPKRRKDPDLAGLEMAIEAPHCQIHSELPIQTRELINRWMGADRKAPGAELPNRFLSFAQRVR